jgi:hypothetical protein
MSILTTKIWALHRARISKIDLIENSIHNFDKISVIYVHNLSKYNSTDFIFKKTIKCPLAAQT